MVRSTSTSSSSTSARTLAATTSSLAPNILNLVRGAAAAASASNSSNPLGALLGSLAPKVNNTINPLAGLNNLVSALAGWCGCRACCACLCQLHKSIPPLPALQLQLQAGMQERATSQPLCGRVLFPAGSGADAVEKTDVLSGLLRALSGGSAAAPASQLVGVVAKMLAATNTDAGNTAALILREAQVVAALHRPDNVTDLVSPHAACAGSQLQICRGPWAAYGACSMLMSLPLRLRLQLRTRRAS